MGYNPHANVCELFDFVKRQKYISEKILATSGKNYFNMFDLSLPLSRIETTRNCVTKLILTQEQIYS